MSNVSPRYGRGLSILLGGLAFTAGTVLSAVAASVPTAWAEPTTEAVDAINDRYATFGGDASLLGAPIGGPADVPGGATQEYQGGAIYYSKDSGARVMYGAILDRYRALGGPAGELGFPKNDESDTGDGTGRFNDFTAPGGAAVYWTPQWGASVVKGRVLDAWRQSGDVAGPFGYPSADTTVVDDIQTGKFAGPEGTQIQWSPAAGLVTIPAALAGTIPGFSAVTPTAEGTTSVTRPTVSGPAAPETAAKSSRWWWIPVGLAVAALLAGLARLLRRRPDEAPPVKITAERTPEVARAPAPAPVPRPAPAPVPPLREVPKPSAPPTKVAPLAATPRAKTTTPPVAPQPLISEPPKAAVKAPPADLPKATIRTETADQDLSPVVKYDTHTPAETAVRVTYQNNAVGTNQASVADKSDSRPD